MNQLVPVQQSNVDAYRASTDAAGLCREIVVNTATNIQGRKYVCVEGWQAIAIAHGCTASACEVERVEGGVRATGQVRRMSDGSVIAEAEGFVGEDEPTWFGGEVRSKYGVKQLPKRPDYAIRAMAQTRAISRACRSAFAHVVVMMNAGLSTTPAEEVPHGGFDNAQEAEYTEAPQQNREGPAPREKLEGKHASKSALQSALRTFGDKVGKSTSHKELDSLMEEFAADLEQGGRYLPKWIEGDPENPDSRGLKALVSDRRRLFDLIDDMKTCDDRKALSGWLNARGDDLDALSDGDRRIWETEYQNFESGLLQAEHLQA